MIYFLAFMGIALLYFFIVLGIGLYEFYREDKEDRETLFRMEHRLLRKRNVP